MYKAGTVVLFANGERKTESVTRSLLEGVTPDVPISYGQRYAEGNGNLIYIVDKVAGRGLLDNKPLLKKKKINLEDLT